MNRIEKLLQKIPKRERIMIEKALIMLYKHDFTQLNCTSLRGYNSIYRIKIGNYRIIYFDDGNEIILKYIRKRNEATYKYLQ